MSRKSLIVYSSRTRNTEKVAFRFKDTLEKHGWECDVFKINRKMIRNPPLPFDFKEYDFVCVGSGIELHEPYHEIIACLRIPRYGSDPIRMTSGPPREKPPELPADRAPVEHHRIVFGPDSKKAIVFVTYSGYDLGPKEAEPAMGLMALEVEHLEFECIGKFSCLGKFINEPTPETYWGDIRDRPNERDLIKAEIFIEEILETMAIRND